MLDSLEILNGVLSPGFEKYNNTYTVNINNTVKKLDIKYDIDDSYRVIISNNDNLSDIVNEVSISIVKDNKIEEVYKLFVNITEEKAVLSQSEALPLEINIQKKEEQYIAPLISVVCFLLILFLFKILFIRKN